MKRPLLPPGRATDIRAGMVVGDNDLLMGKSVPPLVELAPTGPASDVLEEENELTGFPEPSQPYTPFSERRWSGYRA